MFSKLARLVCFFSSNPKDICIASSHPSKYERATWAEKQAQFGWSDVYTKINGSDGRHVQLGSGCYGTVRLAHSCSGDRVAIKKSRHREEAAREVAALSRVRSSQIPVLLAHACTKDAFYLVLQYIDGKSPNPWEAQRSTEDNCQYAVDILSALDACHQSSFVQGDLNSGNVLLRNGRAFLIDFGQQKELQGNHRFACSLMKNALSLFSCAETELCGKFIDSFFTNNKEVPSAREIRNAGFFLKVQWPDDADDLER